MAFDYQGALQAGYTPEEIDSYLSKQPQTTPTHTNQNGGFLMGLLKTAFNQNINAVNKTMQQNAQLPNAKGNFGQAVQNGLTATGNLANNTILNPKLYAEDASMAMPFGQGGFWGSKALIPGAASGALSAASQDEVTPQSVGLGAVGGAVLPVGMQGAGNIIKGSGLVANKLGQAANNSATTLLRGQYEVSPTTSRQLDLPDAARFLFDKYGIANKDTAVNIAKQITGENGIFNQMVNNAIGKLPSVQLSGIHNIAKDALAGATSLDENRSGKILNNIMRAVNLANDGTNIVDANPKIAMQSMRNLEHLANQATNMKFPTEQAIHESNVYKTVAGEIEKRLFEGYQDPSSGIKYPGANDILTHDVKTPEILDKVYSINPKLGWALEHDFNTLRDLRHAQAPFVNVSRASEEAANDRMHTMGPSPMDAAASTWVGLHNPALGAATFIGKPILNSNLMKSGIASVADKVGGAMQPMAKMGGANLNPLLKNLLMLLGSKTGSTTVNYANQ